VTNLTRCWIKDRDAGALISTCHFEGDSGASRSLLQNEDDVTADEALLLYTRGTLNLELTCESNEIGQLFRGEVRLLQEIGVLP
jgi:hypothetical protein